MSKKIFLYDTTLRDGAQMKGINFSLEDKLGIVDQLDKLGIDYIECGWPSSNPKDEHFFKLIKNVRKNHIKIVAFGSTRHAKNKVEEDINLIKLVESGADAVTIFGKTWDLHATKALQIPLEENLVLIEESVSYLKKNGIKEVFFDAEHFFDGYKDNPEYSLKAIKAAEKGGADVIVLADTNGGTMYYEVGSIIEKLAKELKIPLGIHTHNDTGMALANTIEAVRKGAIQVQGTMNGYGERTGNANLCEIIPNLQFKMGYEGLGNNIKRLTKTSRYISEIANMSHSENMPYVGNGAFAHKSGVHVNAVMKDPRTYEHIDPELIGNRRKVLISDLAGRSNVLFKAEELGIKLDKDSEAVKKAIELVKDYENQGYEFEGADGSFELLLKSAMGTRKYFFDLENFRLIVERNKKDITKSCYRMTSEATIKMVVKDSEKIHIVSEGDGPVNALDAALRKSLIPHYPLIENIRLIDYKVRVLNSKSGTASKVRVLVETMNIKTKEKWGTVGVSENIIEASFEALIDSIEYYLHKK
ncbi:MAG: citramalate synthase [Fusobacteria bacterium]|nr:citramalate synthase [Fusobacteriota bacterium]